MSECWYVYAVLLKHFHANVLWLLLNCVNMIVGWVNYRTSGKLKFDKF